MRRVVFLLLVLFTMSASGPRGVAQDASSAFPDNYRKVLDNTDVLVLRVHYGPREQVGVHDHSDQPTVYVYLDDSGPVRFVHEPENVILTRPPTHTGSYRVSPGRRERHSLVNLSDRPSDYLRVELKKVALGTIKQEFRGSAPPNPVQGTTTEFEDPVLRIERVVCNAGSTCDLPANDAPSVLIAFSPAELLEHGRAKPFPVDSSVRWLPGGKEASVRSAGQQAVQVLRIVLPNE